MLHSQGMMTVRYIPNTGNNALFFVSAGRGVLHLLDSLAGKVSEAYDARVGDGHCVLTQPFRNASRIILSLYTSDQVRGHTAASWDAHACCKLVCIGHGREVQLQQRAARAEASRNGACWLGALAVLLLSPALASCQLTPVCQPTNCWCCRCACWT